MSHSVEKILLLVVIVMSPQQPPHSLLHWQYLLFRAQAPKVVAIRETRWYHRSERHPRPLLAEWQRKRLIVTEWRQQRLSHQVSPVSERRLHRPLACFAHLPSPISNIVNSPLYTTPHPTHQHDRECSPFPAQRRQPCHPPPPPPPPHICLALLHWHQASLSPLINREHRLTRCLLIEEKGRWRTRTQPLGQGRWRTRTQPLGQEKYS